MLEPEVPDSTTLIGYVDQRAHETASLDFKGMLGPKLEEAAKDIAALANNLGGNLVVGINEDQERASSFATLAADDLKASRQKLAQALRLLRPEEFQTRVGITPVEVQIGQWVIVVAVPPSPEPVAVDYNDHNLRFPVRIGTHTKYMSYEEVMGNVANARRNYLKLLQMDAEAKPAWLSPLFVRGDDIPGVTVAAMAAFPSADQFHGLIQSPGPEVATIKMSGSKRGGVAIQTIVD